MRAVRRFRLPGRAAALAFVLCLSACAEGGGGLLAAGSGSRPAARMPAAGKGRVIISPTRPPRPKKPGPTPTPTEVKDESPKDEIPEVKDDAPAGRAPKGGIRVSLVWSSPVDLDLYVTDPKLETVYFANTPSGSDGVLEEDVECKDVAGEKDASRSEVVVWEKKQSGRYRVGVDFMDACDSDLESVSAHVVAEADGKLHEQDVTLELERFNPVVLEFDVSGGAGGESGEEPEAGDEGRAKPAEAEQEVP